MSILVASDTEPDTDPNVRIWTRNIDYSTVQKNWDNFTAQ
jgi:hypothetical protein